MASNKSLNLWSGLLQGFTQARQAKKERDLQADTRKLQTKLFEKQLEEMDLRSKAQGELSSMQGNVSEQGPQKPKSILDILADPMGQQLLMQSGQMTAKDIASTQNKSGGFDISKIPPGMILSGVKVTPDGEPMYDFSLPQVSKEVPDASGKNIVSYDKQGNPMGARPAAPEEISLTPAQKAIDTKFAEEYTQFQTAGGYADVQKGINQLNEALKSLKTSDSLSGPVIGGAPDRVLKFVNPEAIAVRESVEEIVQKNLRLVLGPQFTEKEGERLIARSYNPNLDETENSKRLGRLVTQIQQAASAKMQAIKYYEENGTLAGFTGKIPNIGDFDPASDKIILTPEDEALVNKYR